MSPAALSRSEPATRASPWRRRARIGVALFSIGALGLVIWKATALDWPSAWRAIGSLPASALLLATAAALLGHANYGAFDLLARRWLRLDIGRLRCWAIALVSYACTLNFGALLGGAAMRWRLYDAAGLGGKAIAQVVTLAIVTNWLGFASLAAGLVLLQGQGLLSEAHAAEPTQVQGAVAEVASAVRHWLEGSVPPTLASGVLALLAAWAVLVAWRGIPPWRALRLQWQLPTRPQALAQWLLGMANWLCMVAVLWCLLQPLAAQPVSFGLVLWTHLLASLAVLVARIPGGIGVLEAVYLWLLHDQVASGPLLGALLVFRALYFLLPLVWAGVGYALLTRAPRAGPERPAALPAPAR
ncbi:MAG: YbhN family protein [Burkholderiales bacterium]